MVHTVTKVSTEIMKHTRANMNKYGASGVEWIKDSQQLRGLAVLDPDLFTLTILTTNSVNRTFKLYGIQKNESI